MQKFPGMEHEEPFMRHVRPGQQGDVVWRFNREGEFVYGCRVLGHRQAGMRGTIRVVDRRP